MSRILINPLNIPYQFQHYNHQASRESADPTLVYFKGHYYLFASMSGGFYFSDDMIHWNWHENRKLTPFRYAPDVRQVGDWLIFSSSDRDPSEIYRTKDPMSDDFEKLSEPFPFWDPNTFQDEDGRVYFYWGCANTTPIWGQEFDPEAMTPIGEKKELIFGNTAAHGWERPNYPGRPKEQGKEGLAMRLYRLFMRLSGSDKKPFIEGAFMNKWNGKYYLQYAAPGTELATYGDGVYVGDSPLGPFTYQAHNPFSSKPGGFITGAGHGSTIEDEYGNLWHASTMRISVNANFERRLGLFPAGLDKDGTLFCNQNFADYPLDIPEGKFDPQSIHPKWMLLSYRKAAVASSSREGHGPEMALNEDIRSCWCANGSAGEWYKLDLGDAHIKDPNRYPEELTDNLRYKISVTDGVEPGRSVLSITASINEQYLKDSGYGTMDVFMIKHGFTAETTNDRVLEKLVHPIDFSASSSIAVERALYKAIYEYEGDDLVKICNLQQTPRQKVSEPYCYMVVFSVDEDGTQRYFRRQIKMVYVDGEYVVIESGERESISEEYIYKPFTDSNMIMNFTMETWAEPESAEEVSG